MTDRIAIIGAGGREHALALRLREDAPAASIVALPGNDGMDGDIERLAVRLDDVEALARACVGIAPDLVVVGPEAPLAAGLVDRLAAAGIPACGPTAAAARLESSKAFAKEVMRAAGVPTAEAEVVETLARADATLARFGPPWVVKADGLAAGKGVLVTRDRDEAKQFLEACLSGERFGDAGRRVVIERFLEGEELSVMALTDGARVALLPAARDYKRAFDGDAGPNTGGMGAYAPTEALDADAERHVAERFVAPVLAELARRGSPYRGVLYAGLVRTARGLQVLEFNARFGDPETQVVLPLLEGSVLEALTQVARGALDLRTIGRLMGAAVTIAIVDERYPEPPSGKAWLAPPAPGAVHGARLLTAGVARRGERLGITGGRAAYACAVAEHMDEARRRAYALVDRVGGSGWRCRRDVANAAATHALGSR